MTHCQIKNALAACRLSLARRPETRQLRLRVRSLSFYLVTAQRFILGLTDISTMPSIRSINLPEQTLALAQQLQLLLVAVLLQSV